MNTRAAVEKSVMEGLTTILLVIRAEEPSGGGVAGEDVREERLGDDAVGVKEEWRRFCHDDSAHCWNGRI